MKRFLFGIFFSIFYITPSHTYCWGFFAHQQINRIAIFSLPVELVSFYKKNIRFITENAVAPDKKRYTVKEEGPRHYIDVDSYGENAFDSIPKHWRQAAEKYSEDTLMAYGIVPWHINTMKHRLTDAFRRKDIKNILKLSAELGHYIADAHVPLHTTKNYNGQYTNQKGIHGLWESRLPELFFDGYNFFTGPATYIENPQLKAWDAVRSANNALDSVLKFEKSLSERFPQDKKYSFEERNGITTKVYSKEYCQAYHKMLSGMVERQMKASIKMVSDFWYTCWIDAGQPTLIVPAETEYLISEWLELEKQESDSLNLKNPNHIKHFGKYHMECSH